MSARFNLPPEDRKAVVRRTKASVSARYACANQAAAEIILRDAARYGSTSLMVVWATAIIEGRERERNDWRLVA